jgi:hypothetical protein
MNTNLKILMSAVGLVALAATPVLAKPHAQHTYYPVHEQAVTGDTVVTSGGKVVGADPDLNVRFELERDSANGASASGSSGPSGR